MLSVIRNYTDSDDSGSDCEMEVITVPITTRVTSPTTRVATQSTLHVGVTSPSNPSTTEDVNLPLPIPSYKTNEHPCLISKHAELGYELTYFANNWLHAFATNKTLIHSVSERVLLVNFVETPLQNPLYLPLPAELCDYENTQMEAVYDENLRAIVLHVKCENVDEILTHQYVIVDAVTKDGFVRYNTTVFENPMKHDKDCPRIIWIKSKFAGFDTNMEIDDEHDIVEVKYLLGVVKVTVEKKPDVPLVVVTTIVDGDISQPPTITDNVQTPVVEKEKLKLAYVIGKRHMTICKRVDDIGYNIDYHIDEELSKHARNECFTYEISGDYILVNFTKQELEEPLKFPLPIGLCDFSNTNLVISCMTYIIRVYVKIDYVQYSLLDKQDSNGILMEDGNCRYPTNVTKIQWKNITNPVAGKPINIYIKSKFNGFDTLTTHVANRKIAGVKYEQDFVTVIYKPCPKKFTYNDGEYEKHITKLRSDFSEKTYYKCCYNIDKELHEFLKTTVTSLSNNIVGQTIHINNERNPMETSLIIQLPAFPFAVSNNNLHKVEICHNRCRISIVIACDENIEICHYTKAQIDSLNGSYDQLVFKKNIATNPYRSIVKRNATYITLLTKSAFDGFNTEFEYNFPKKFKNIQENVGETVLEFETKVTPNSGVALPTPNSGVALLTPELQTSREEPVLKRKELDIPKISQPVKKHKQTHFDGNDIIEIDETINTIQFSHKHADKTHELTFANPPEIKNAENGGWNCLLHFANFDTCQDVTSIEADVYFGKLWIFLYADYDNGKTVGRVANIALHSLIANKKLDVTGSFNTDKNTATINITEAK